MGRLADSIHAAIARGVPLFNRGDRAGCFRVYRECASQLISSRQAEGRSAAVLSSALQQAEAFAGGSQGQTAGQQAWIMRRALDAVLALPNDSKPTTNTSPSSSSSSRSPTGILRQAISMGVPVYNSGDLKGCADIYLAAARLAIKAMVGGSSAPEGLAEAVQQASAQAGTGNHGDAAWTLRRAFDTLLAAGDGGGRGGAGRGAPPPYEAVTDTGAAVDPESNYLSQALVWRVVNDSVMGGRSSSSVQVQGAEGEGVLFSGDFQSRGGGFASARAVRADGRPVFPPLSADYQGLAVTAKGDGGRYKLVLRRDVNMADVGWQADFLTTNDGKEATFQLPFSSFVPSWRGRSLPDKGPVDPGRVLQLGILLSKLTDMGYANPQVQPPSSVSFMSCLLFFCPALSWALA